MSEAPSTGTATLEQVAAEVCRLRERVDSAQRGPAGIALGGGVRGVRLGFPTQVRPARIAVGATAIARAWCWASLPNRTAFGGPQQFIRISTPVINNDLASADKLLQELLPQWLQRGDYQGEYAAFLAAKKLGERR